MTLRDDCAAVIRWVAERADDRAAFEGCAVAAAERLTPAAIETLAGLFHGETSPPTPLARMFPRLGQWIAARQCAIFEMFYCFGEPALPVLRRVAFGAYDWTQANAIDVLCRLAADGVAPEQTVADLKAAMPEMREEALLSAAQALLERAEASRDLASIVRQLEEVPAFGEAATEVRAYLAQGTG